MVRWLRSGFCTPTHWGREILEFACRSANRGISIVPLRRSANKPGFARDDWSRLVTEFSRGSPRSWIRSP
jgi:hypothetical protein